MAGVNSIFNKDEVRYLSAPETFMHELTKHSEHYGLFSNIETIASPFPLSEAAIRTALNRLCNNHDLLRSSISRDSNGDYYFEIHDNLDDNDDDWVELRSLSVDSTNKWLEIVNEELQLNFIDGRGPVWRAVVLLPVSTNTSDVYNYTFIFTCNHCILDGKGGFDIFGIQFLEILENVSLNKVEDEDVRKPVSLLKSYTDIFFDFKGAVSKQYYPMRFIYNILFVIMHFLFWLVKKSGILAVEKRKPEFRAYNDYQQDKKHVVDWFDFSEELSSAIMKFCKDNSCSVTAFQLVSLSSALRKTSKDFPPCSDTVKTFLYATDLRKFNSHLSEPPLGCGLYVDVEFQDIIPIDDIHDVELFKSISKKVTEDIRRRTVPPNLIKKLMHTSMNQMLGMTGFDPQEKLVSIPGLDRPLSFSNIGNCDDLPDNRRQSKTIRLVEHHSTVLSPAPILMNVCTYNRQMRYCICYNGHWLSAHFVKTLVNNFKEIMENIVL